MRRLPLALSSSLLALALVTGARAATLEASGTLAISIGALPPIQLVDPGSTPILVSSGGGHFTAFPGVVGPGTVALPKSLFTGIPQISGLTLASFGNGTLVASGAGTATGGLQGDAVVTVMQLVNLTIPLDVVGVPGGSLSAAAGAIIISVFGQGWTTGVASVTGITTTTPGTNIVNTATRSAGGDLRTPGHLGTLTLVSGFRVVTNVVGNLPGFATQTFNFPEPKGLLVLGIAFLGLVMARRRRGR